MTGDDSAEQSPASCSYRSESGEECRHPSLDGDDLCIWHAEIAGKVLAGDRHIRTSGAIHEAKLAGAKIRQVDLSDVRFVDCTFEESIFEDTTLSGTQFHGCQFDGAEFVNCTLSQSRFETCSLANARVRESDFTDSILVETQCPTLSIIQSDISGSDWARIDASEVDIDDTTAEGIRLRETELTGSRIRRSSFAEADCAGSQLRDATVQRTDFANASFEEADLNNLQTTLSTFSDVTFRRGSLINTSFVDADCASATFERADLTDSEFSDCSLAKCSFLEADLTDAQLERSDMNGSLCRRADCTDTSFEESDLTDVDFGGTVLYGVRLGGADLRQLRFDARTELKMVYQYGQETGEYHRDEAIFRGLAQACSRNGLSRLASEFRYRTKVTQRRQAFQSVRTSDTAFDRTRALQRWLGLRVAGDISGYGERPVRIVYSAVWTIVTFALLYVTVGGASGTAPGDPIPGTTMSLMEALIFSVSAFTGISGAGTAATPMMQLLAGIESLLGLGYVVLFVFTLSRRTMDI